MRVILRLACRAITVSAKWAHRSREICRTSLGVKVKLIPPRHLSGLVNIFGSPGLLLEKS